MSDQKVQRNNFKFGIIQHPQCKEIINNVYSFMYHESKAEEPILRFNKIISRVSVATGVSEASTTKIINEYEKILTGKLRTFSSEFFNSNKRGNKEETHMHLSDEEKVILRRIVLDIFINKKNVPLITEIFNEYSKSVKFDGEPYPILKSIGFHSRRIGTKFLFYEDFEIRRDRLNYIREMQNFRSESCSEVYLSKIYINGDYDTSEKSNKIKPKFALVTAVDKNGSLVYEPLIYELSTINHDRELYLLYSNWFNNKIVINTKDTTETTVVVIPESIIQFIKEIGIPSEDSTKEVISKWLEYHNISFNEGDLKSMLLELVLENKSKFEWYYLNQLLRNTSLQFLKLPLNHVDLNPIGSVWSDFEDFIDQNRPVYNIQKLRSLYEIFFKQFPKEKWKTCWENVKQSEEYYLLSEPIVDSVCDELINNPHSQINDMMILDELSDGYSENEW